MEKNELIPREELELYFEKGKRPTQDQFSDLIDSLQHKADILTNKEAVMIANSLESIDNGYIEYTGNNIGDKKFVIAVKSEDEEDQLITINETQGNSKKLYFFGNAPYTIRAKEFPAEGLGETEYYHLNCQIGPSSAMTRLFGNTLPAIPGAFEFGTMEDKNLTFRIEKINPGQKMKVVNTSIQFVNKTEIPIQYMTQSGYWAYIYTDKDIVTDHYDLWDYLYLYLKADLSKTDQSIECNVYDANTGALLRTANLNARQNNQNIMAGEATRQIRSLRIECHYAIK
ncbi:hypothetical protein F3J23_14395 [Chryseobacterium sp. Tr-659]|uniref:hypothetical protein n=1 Tax=Chryseobacterium sp. Tr-659 TaxID=2608340 RepID=UPI0014200DA0|nr:hypothetical protein [Chryseobacterium sp. Tr-659]NIF06636.1 hypothetical protein [Chryseobacterium sp. Tr-659]